MYVSALQYVSLDTNTVTPEWRVLSLLMSLIALGS
jgi:hypothetical protein